MPEDLATLDMTAKSDQVFQQTIKDIWPCLNKPDSSEGKSRVSHWARLIDQSCCDAVPHFAGKWRRRSQPRTDSLHSVCSEVKITFHPSGLDLPEEAAKKVEI